jgi:hypothetical protein
MARLALKCIFSVLLALLTAQAAVPSARSMQEIVIVCCIKAEQQIPREARHTRPVIHVLLTVPTYVSRTLSEPDSFALFQRPPPKSLFFL